MNEEYSALGIDETARVGDLTYGQLTQTLSAALGVQTESIADDIELRVEKKLSIMEESLLREITDFREEFNAYRAGAQDESTLSLTENVSIQEQFTAFKAKTNKRITELEQAVREAA